MSNHLSINEITKILPHRYPMLLVDKVVEYDFSEQTMTAIKNVTINEEFFMGHFPNRPVMPGVLIVEAMAQVAGIYAIKSQEIPTQNKLVYFMSIENTKFRKPVEPGDQLYIHVKKIQQRGNVWKFSCVGMVDHTKVAQATLSAMITDGA